jgi:hypothetical protein
MTQQPPTDGNMHERKLVSEEAARTAAPARLFGAFWGHNFGDILLARLTADWAVSAHPALKPMLWRPGNGVVEAVGSGATAIQARRETLGGVLLLSGGGYFGEPANPTWAWRKRLLGRIVLPALAYRAAGIPTAIIGVGVGPLRSRFARAAVTRLCEAAEITVVRDAESYHYLLEWGVDPGKVIVTADSALTIEEAPTAATIAPDTAAILRSLHGRRIMVVHIPGSGSEGRRVAEAVRRFSVGAPDTVILCIADRPPNEAPFGPNHGWLKSEMKNVLFTTYQDPDSLVAVLAASNVLVTTKLHVGIVGAALRRNVISIPTHPKTARFYRQIGCPERCLEESDTCPSDLADRIAYFDSRDEGIDVPNEVVSAARRNREVVIQHIHEAMEATAINNPQAL